MNSQGHLTDDQFAECASTEPVGDAAAHLDVCEACRAELALFTATMQDFHTAAVHWSEAQPRVSLRGVQAARPSLIAHPAARWALATVLVVAAAAPVVLHGDRAPDETAAVQAPAAVDDSQDTIAEDNRLMERVTLALNTPEPSPLDEYGLGQSAATSRAASNMRSQ